MATGATRAGSIRAGGGDREQAGADTDTDGHGHRAAMRHPVTVRQFQNPILEIVFNPKNFGPKTFQFRANGQGDFGNRI
jgi:hypothetical protein